MREKREAVFPFSMGQNAVQVCASHVPQTCQGCFHVGSGYLVRRLAARAGCKEKA